MRIKEILEELIEGKYNYTDERVRNRKIDSALFAIKEEIGKCAPVEIKDSDMPEHERVELFELYKNGYNQSLSDFKTNLEKLTGEDNNG